MTIKLQEFSLVEKEEPVKVRFTLRLRDQHSMWKQDGYKVYMDSHIASNGSCFMVTRNIFQNHLLEIGLTQNHGTLNACNHWFILFYHVQGPAWIEIHRNSIRSRAHSHMTSHYTWESVTTLHDFGGVLGWPLDTLFWVSQFHGHGSWLMCEVALNRPLFTYIDVNAISRGSKLQWNLSNLIFPNLITSLIWYFVLVPLTQRTIFNTSLTL